MKLLDIAKKLPIDLGQGNLRYKTKGKLIALGLVKQGKDKRALDVGCREGIQSEFLKKKGYSVVPIDIEKKYKDCIIVDVNKKLPFKDASFDLIWCSEVIEHLDDPSKTIQEFKRILKLGGEIILTTPNSYCLIFRFLSIFGLTPEKMQREDHKYFFSEKDIVRLFPKAKLYGYFPYYIFKFKINKLVGLLSPTLVIYQKK